jgi:hypothetical protein
MIPFLHQFLCLVRHPMQGHSYVRVFEGSRVYEVCLCGARTSGWAYGESAAETHGTQPYWDRLHEDLLSMEWELHGGG